MRAMTRDSSEVAGHAVLAKADIFVCYDHLPTIRVFCSQFMQAFIWRTDITIMAWQKDVRVMRMQAWRAVSSISV